VNRLYSRDSVSRYAPLISRNDGLEWADAILEVQIENSSCTSLVLASPSALNYLHNLKLHKCKSFNYFWPLIYIHLSC